MYMYIYTRNMSRYWKSVWFYGFGLTSYAGLLLDGKYGQSSCAETSFGRLFVVFVLVNVIISKLASGIHFKSAQIHRNA